MGFLQKRSTKSAMAAQKYATTLSPADILAASEELIASAPTTTAFKSLRYIIEPKLAILRTDTGQAVVDFQCWATPKKGGDRQLGRTSFRIAIARVGDTLDVATVNAWTQNDAVVDRKEHDAVRQAIDALIKRLDPGATAISG